MIVIRTNNKVTNSIKPTRQLNMRVATMTEPTKPLGTKTPPKARGKKSNPPAALAGDGGLQSAETTEHTENVAQPAQTDNANNDRGGRKEREGQEQESIEADPWWKRSASTLNASPQSEHVTQHTFIAWQRQVLFDRSLNLYARTILAAFASEAVSRVENADSALYVEPVPSSIWSDLGISKSTYYRYLVEAEGSGWIKKVGSFEYKTGERTEIGDAYLVVMKKDAISP